MIGKNGQGKSGIGEDLSVKNTFFICRNQRLHGKADTEDLRRSTWKCTGKGKDFFTGPLIICWRVGIRLRKRVARNTFAVQVDGDDFYLIFEQFDTECDPEVRDDRIGGSFAACAFGRDLSALGDSSF